MSEIKVNNVEPDAYKGWLKESFLLVKRSPLVFLLLSMLPAIYTFNELFLFVSVISMPLFYGFTMLIFGLKADHSISIWEAWRRFDFKETGFYKTFLSPYGSEVVLYGVLILLSGSLLLITSFIPETSSTVNAADIAGGQVEQKEDGRSLGATFFSTVISLFLALSYGAFSLLKNFNMLFNVFFGVLTKDEFENRYLKDILKLGKPIISVMVFNYILLFGMLFIVYLYDGTPKPLIISISVLMPLFAFTKLVEYVAFREIFLGRGKNKKVEAKVKQDINQLAPQGT